MTRRTRKQKIKASRSNKRVLVSKRSVESQAENSYLQADLTKALSLTILALGVLLALSRLL